MVKQSPGLITPPSLLSAPSAVVIYPAGASDIGELRAADACSGSLPSPGPKTPNARPTEMQYVGSLVKVARDPVSAELGVDREAVPLGKVATGSAECPDVVPAAEPKVCYA
jgi:hypothetical protein